MFFFCGDKTLTMLLRIDSECGQASFEGDSKDALH